MRHSHRQPGFAMILVLVLLATATIIGLTYATSSSIKMISSRNLLEAGRARYLAESGLHHALYVLRTDPDSLDNSQSSPLGPYYADDSSDSYTFYAIKDADKPGVYTIVAEASCGKVKQRSTMIVLRGSDAKLEIPYGVMSGGGFLWCPSSVDIKGNAHFNGSFFNMGKIDGDVSATGSIWDAWRGITGDIKPNAPYQELPSIKWDGYQKYVVNGVTYSAAKLETNEFKKNDPLADGGSITATNMGGVVWLVPKTGSNVILPKNLKFKGTLIIDGNLIIDGKSIKLEAVEGFPAIVATGRIYVSNSGKAEIKGLVKASGGIVSLGYTPNAETDIQGGLISDARAYDSGLKGEHKLEYKANRCAVYDVTGASGVATSLEILDVGR